MKPARTWKWYVLSVALLLLPITAYWLADAWLESSGGRQMLEQELSRRLGMSVRIEGEFDLMLLPDIGVSGTELIVGAAGTGLGIPESQARPFATSREFEVSVALRPLFRRQLVVEWIRLSNGRVYPGRYPHSGSGSDGATAESAERQAGRQNASVVLPEIQELALSEFDFVLDEEKGSVIHLKTLELRDFGDRKQAPFRLEFEDLLTVEGWLRWDTLQSKIDLGNLSVAIGKQEMGGNACVFLTDPPALNIEAQAETFDLDAVMDLLPDMGSGGEDLPLDIRARLAVDELRTNGVVARGVVLNLGPDPSCD